MIRMKIIKGIGLPLLAGLCLGGCASPPEHSAWPESRPLGAPPHTAAPATRDDGPTAPAPEPAGEPAGTLHLDEALAATLTRSPELEAFSYEVRAAEARILQANRLPNPKLGIEVEEFNRDGAGADSAEAGLVLKQQFQLGRKRYWRTRMAEVEGELAGWRYESKRLDIFTAARQRFLAVIAAQRKLELSRSSVELAEKAAQAVNTRVSAGKEPQLQAAKASAELEMARIVALEAENAMDVARRRLAALWGSETAMFDLAKGNFDTTLDTMPPLADLRPLLTRNPDLARWDATQRLRATQISTAKAARVPDVTGAFGVQHYQEDDTSALAFGLSLPLPLFDRNRGAIEAARQSEDAAQATRAALELQLATQLVENHARLVVAHRRVEALRTKVVPTMAAAFEAAHDGYVEGKFGFLDMLDAQRSLFEVRTALVNAQVQYHTAISDLERLTGTPLDLITHTEGEDKS